jgi:hypothetical protein
MPSVDQQFGCSHITRSEYGIMEFILFPQLRESGSSTVFETGVDSWLISPKSTRAGTTSFALVRQGRKIIKVKQTLRH